MSSNERWLTREELKELFAEWTEDYAAARERDRRDVVRPTAPEPASKPEQLTPAKDQQNDRDGGTER